MIYIHQGGQHKRVSKFETHFPFPSKWGSYGNCDDPLDPCKPDPSPLKTTATLLGNSQGPVWIAATLVSQLASKSDYLGVISQLHDVTIQMPKF